MRSRCSSECVWIAEDQLLRRAAESLADVHVEAAFPIAVAESRGRRCDRQLVRHEVIVRNGISREMREIPEAKGAQRLGLGVVVDLESDVPRVTVPAGRGVFLGDARIRGDRSVEEIVGKGSQQLGDALPAAQRSTDYRDRQQRSFTDALSGGGHYVASTRRFRSVHSRMGAWIQGAGNITVNAVQPGSYDTEMNPEDSTFQTASVRCVRWADMVGLKKSRLLSPLAGPGGS